MKDNKKIQEGTNLMKSSVTTQDSGIYTCVATNVAGKAEKIFKVSVVEFPKFLFKPKNVSILPDEIRNVECFAHGNPEPQIYWLFDGQKIKQGSELSLNGKMKIGVYSCIAENSESKAEEKFHFDVLSKPTMLRNFNQADSLKFVSEGRDLQLLCPFENFDFVLWMHKNKIMKSQKSDKLELKNVNQRSKGEYRCVAYNLVGAVEFSYTVDLLTPPIFHDAFETKLFTAGKSGQLDCAAFGNPAPKIHWTRFNLLVGEGSTFKIANVAINDAGNFICTAANSEGVAEKIYDIHVSSPPFIKDGMPVDLEKFVGEKAKLRCRMGGSPKPKISWMKNG